jgi:formylglycine-generating enzyme required for sulfatase activity
MHFNSTRVFIYQTILIALLNTLAGNLAANNISIHNLSLTGKNSSSHTELIQFDLSWENSWRTTGAPNNCDAAWVFAKYRTPVADGGDGIWKHVHLNNSGHSATAEALITAGLLDPTSPFNEATNPALGVFIYRESNGKGSFSLSGLELLWNYGANGVADKAFVEIEVFAIEMVYVPSGSFFVGSGGTESESFTNGSWISGSSVPLSIGSEKELVIAPAEGGLWSIISSGNNSTLVPGALPEAYPKGFNAFAVMKYEISQQGYVNFLNTLTRVQQSAHVTTTIAPGIQNISNRYVLSNTNIPQFRNGISCDLTVSATEPITFYCDLNGNGKGGDSNDGADIACNFLSWNDLSSYLVWSGLRPMSELEFEKSCRGNLDPVAGEYSWGTTLVNQNNGIVNPGATNEGVLGIGNCTYGNSSLYPGPLRVGVLTTSSSNRISAGSTFFGILEMSGNVEERVVNVSSGIARKFLGSHGNGNLDQSGNTNASDWPDFTARGTGLRGGNWNKEQSALRISDRSSSSVVDGNRSPEYGGRGVRGITLDLTPPLPANGGSILISDITADRVTLSWKAASDNLTNLQDLYYQVYYSKSNSIQTVLDCENNGIPFGTFNPNSSCSTITGLDQSTTYYFNVIVKDSGGNKAIYRTAYGTTLLKN